MYYHPRKKEILSYQQLCSKYNTSIPLDEEEYEGYYKLYNTEYPEISPYGSVAVDKIKKIDGHYTQLYTIIPESIENKTERYKELVQEYLNETVKEKDYNSIENACSYIFSTNQSYMNDAQSAIRFRDAVWEKAYELLSDESFETMTDEYFMSQLPRIEWQS